MGKLTEDERWQRILDLGKEIRRATSEMLALLDSANFDEKLKATATEMISRIQELEKEQQDLMDEALK